MLTIVAFAIILLASIREVERMSKVLVIGATGNQGGAVTRAALGDGHSVVAFTRNSEGKREQALAARGVELATGSLDDPGSIQEAAESVDAVFAMTTPFGGLDTEVRHGKNIADAVRRAKVPHLVFSSVASADQDTGIGHFDSKWEIEQHIAELDIPSTVVAPVFFMNNYLFPWNTADIANGVLRQAVETAVPLQMVAAEDIGRFVATVLGSPSHFIGQRIEIAGDELTGPQLASTIATVAGHPVAYEVQPYAELDAMGSDWRRMYEWFNEGGFTVDRNALASEYPNFEFDTFASWVRSQDWENLLAPQSV